MHENLQVCNICRELVVAQPIKTSETSISTRDPGRFHLYVVTWCYVIGHVWTGGAWSSPSDRDDTWTVQRAELNIVDLHRTENKCRLMEILLL